MMESREAGKRLVWGWIIPFTLAAIAVLLDLFRRIPYVSIVRKEISFVELATFYLNWDSGLTSNVLGVVAQLLGFLMTFLITALFVASQYLGDKLPQSIVRPMLWGTKGIEPIFRLAVLMLLDIVVYALSGQILLAQKFSPVCTLAFILFGFVLVGKECIQGLISSVQAFNVNSIISNYRDRAVDAANAGNVVELASALQALGSIADFALNRGQTDVADRAVRRFLEVSLKWSEKRSHFLELLAGADERKAKAFETSREFLFTGPQRLLQTAIANQNGVVFQSGILHLADRLPAYDEGVQGEYVKTLDAFIAYYPVISNPHYVSVMVAAGGIVADHGVEKADVRLASLGLTILRKGWSVFSLVDSVNHRLQCVKFTSELVHGTITKNMETVLTEAIKVFTTYGIQSAEQHDETVFNIWVQQYEFLLNQAITTGRHELIKELAISSGVSVYEVSERSEFPTACRSVLRAIQRVVRKVPKELVAHVAFAYERSYRQARNTQNETAVVEIGWVFREAYDRAKADRDLKTMGDILLLLSSTPLRQTTSGFNLLAFVGSAVDSAVSSSDKDASQPLLDAVLRLMLNAESPSKSALNHLIKCVNGLLGADLLDQPTKLRLVRFCFNDNRRLDNDTRAKLFDTIGEMVKTAEDPQLLALAKTECRSSISSAVETHDETLLRAISNYLGWLAYGVISAKMRLPERRNILKDIMDIAAYANKYARLCGLPQNTLVFLATLYVVIGGVCEELDALERESLLNCVVESAVSVVDMDTLEAAKFARETYPMRIVRSPRESYGKFLSDIRVAVAQASKVSTQ